MPPYRLDKHPLPTLTYEELYCGVFQTTFMASSDITTGTPTTPTLQTSTSKTARNTANATTLATTSNSPTTHFIYVKQGFGYNNDLAFYDTIVLDNGPEIVHNSHYNGWVYLWTVPSTCPYSGFMMALYIVLLVSGVVLIVASLYALYQLHKLIWVLGKASM